MPQKSQRLKKAKRLKKSSQKWLLRQINDPFVERAKSEGWRSRAAFKIIEVDEKFKIFKKGKVVVDLGAAPGGWSQYAVTKVGDGNVVALDLLEIDPIAGVNFFQGDFLEIEAPARIISLLKELPHNKSGRCDIVLSDMAANTTGDNATDHMRIINLLEEALGLAGKILNNGGCFVGKIFQGGSSDEILKKLQKNFSIVRYFKPESSRKGSSETYLVAIGFKFKSQETDAQNQSCPPRQS
jgi:23S rRNA (uridine2552-2'-O)-methyltransferase